MSVRYGSTIGELSRLGSEIRTMFLRGQQKLAANPNLELIDLSLGNPDIEPPPELLESLARLAAAKTPGVHRYMDNAGFADVRAFLASELSKSEGVQLQKEDVFMTCGAAGAIQIAMRAVLDPGDEVIVLAPYFSEYIPYSVNFGAKPVVVETDANHQPSVASIQRAITPKTRLIMLNYPNNPSGVTYSPSFLSELATMLADARRASGQVIFVLSDEPYCRLNFDGRPHASLLSKYPFTFLVRSHSKDLGLAGERIGYLVVSQELAGPETLLTLRNSARALGFVNAPALMQRLVLDCYHYRVDVSQYETRVREFVKILREGGLDVVSPDAGFFVFPRSPIADDRGFCDLLVDNGVLTVPGVGFGRTGHFRVSLTQSLNLVKIAAERIVKVSGLVRGGL